ncbi:MAG: glycosyltransferase family 8 protein [Bacteroidota bacterium]|nr:glycosyltransferase family 8 protein [Bacteroidota bacterium]
MGEQYKKELIHVACCFDENYVQHAGVMIYSLSQSNPNFDFHIYCITDSISEENKKTILDIFEKIRISHEFIKVDSQLFNNFHVNGHVTFSTYFRLLIPILIPNNIFKLLYIDCDCIINGSISNLWETDISNYFCAASKEYYSIEKRQSLGINNNTLCFNAGVLLINLTKWRQIPIFNIAKRIIEEKNTNLTSWDQDVLNIIFQENWLEIPVAYNYREYYYNYFTAEHKQKPIIIHYVAKLKPWHFMSKHKYKNLYYKYLKKTPWKKFIPEDRTIGNLLRKYGLFPNFIYKNIIK